MRLTGYRERHPAAFSQRLEAQHLAQSTLRLFAGGGFAGRYLVASCTASQCRFALDIHDGSMGQHELFRNRLRSTNYRVLNTKRYEFLLLDGELCGRP